MNNCSEKPSPPHYTNIYDPNLVFDDNPPLVDLTFWPDSGIVNETEFTFNASGSKEKEIPDAGLYYRWDFNNDNIWDTPESQEPKIKYIYKKGGGNIKLKLSVRGAKFLYADTTVSLFVNTRPYISLNWISDLNNENLIHFDASTSWDYEDGNELEYRWDLNNDGAWDTPWNGNPLADHLFTKPDWTIKIEVRDTYHLSTKKTIVKNLPTDYTAYYPFNGNANDESGYGNNGIVHGAILTKDRFGNQNGAFYFDGFNDYIVVPDNDLLTPAYNKLTVALWAKVYGLVNKYFLCKGDSSTNREYSMDFRFNSLASFDINNQGGALSNQYVISSETILKENTWYYIVGTWDGTEHKIYINGLLENFSSPHVEIGNYDSDLYIGSYGGDILRYAINAVIDDIRIYNRALSDAEVFALYKEEPQ